MIANGIIKNFFFFIKLYDFIIIAVDKLKIVSELISAEIDIVKCTYL